MSAHLKVVRPEIYRYHDYRVFLRDWLAYRKASQPGFSLRVLAKQVDLASGHLPMILSGARALSSKVLAKLGPALGLTQRERSYLELLVTLESTDSQDVRVEILERMKKFGAYQRNNPKEAETSEYLTRWYYIAIREMVLLKGFVAEAKWIQDNLRASLPLSQIKEALDFLIQKNFIKIQSNGQVSLPEKQIDCLSKVFSVALTQYHHQMLSLAATSIENSPTSERNILGHTLAIDAGQFAEANAILTEAFEKIRALGLQKATGDSVYHVELALFPLTKNIQRSIKK